MYNIDVIKLMISDVLSNSKNSSILERAMDNPRFDSELYLHLLQQLSMNSNEARILTGMTSLVNQSLVDLGLANHTKFKSVKQKTMIKNLFLVRALIAEIDRKEQYINNLHNSRNTEKSSVVFRTDY